MNSSEAKQIFLQAMPELSEPLKSAVEFTLSNWKNVIRDPRPSDVAINFFASLPSLPTNDIDEIFAVKLNEMAKLLRDDSDVWLSLEDLPHEEWRNVIGYEGFYQVSNYGRVKSFYFKGGRILRHTRREGEYIMLSLSKNKEIENCLLHVLVAQAFLPNPENLPVVHHKDNDKVNACIWNLVWVTRSENTKLAYKSGAMKQRHGHENFNSKLSPEQVRYIRTHYIPYDKIFGAHALARKLNVTPSAVVDVTRHKTYKNVV